MGFVVEDTKEIARPREEVFDFFSDMINETKWNPNVKTIESTTEGPIGIGTGFKAVYRKQGSMSFHITEYDRPSHWAMAGTAPGVHFTFTSDMEDAPGGTRVHSRAEFDAKGPMKLLMPVMKNMMKKQMLDSQANLKAYLENTAPTG